MSRRIAVFTASRADLGPLAPVIRCLLAEEGVEPLVLAAGTHALEDFKADLDQLHLSAEHLAVVQTTSERAGAEDYGLVFSAIAAGVSRRLAEGDIDILLVLGDRWELLAVAGVALIHGVPLAHLHGGETTEGAMDERIRHGMSKIADLHLCATTDSARRLRALGEESWRIHVTGAPGLDRLRVVEPLPASRLQALAGVEDGPLGVVVYHPETVDRLAVEDRVRLVLNASRDVCSRLVVLLPGADPGAEFVRKQMLAFGNDHGVHVYATLADEYLRLLASADVLIGNSSSGIIEAASLGLPVVDVGERQRGRLRPQNVLSVREYSHEALVQAIRAAVDPEFRRMCSTITNPYGDGRASERIVALLRDIDLRTLPRKAPVRTAPRTSVERLLVRETASLGDVLRVLEDGAGQIALLVDDGDVLIGTFTDGDVRRALLTGAALTDAAAPHCNTSPLTTSEDALSAAVALMRTHGVLQLPRLDESGRPIALLRLIDVAGESILDDEG
jgi:UDP-N-acetylglucosamine 2-epimerase (non-hydrolysing)